MHGGRESGCFGDASPNAIPQPQALFSIKLVLSPAMAQAPTLPGPRGTWRVPLPGMAVRSQAQ